MAYSETRSKVKHSVFGAPKELPKRQLPTCRDVFKAYLWYQFHSSSNFNIQRCAEMIYSDLKRLYDNASIPTIEPKSIIIKVKRLIEKGQELRKYPSSKRSSTTYQTKVNTFDTLFDICSCKCYKSGVLEHSQCYCSKENKIPVDEWNFWKDQHNERQMIIGNVDKEATSKLQQREERLTKRKLFEEKQRSKLDCEETADLDHESTLEDSELESVGSDSIDESDITPDKAQNRYLYPELCKAIDRCKVSNRDACLIVNAALKDLNLLSDSTIIDPRKLRRQRDVWRKKEISEHLERTKRIACLGFDGKIDNTLVTSVCSQRTQKEDHYVLVSYPGDNYVDHVAPNSHKAIDICDAIMSVITSTDSKQSLKAVICDSTNVNTGKVNGVIRRLELSLKRPLQWFICLLHTNELPLRKYFKVLDGETTGPKTSLGDIGKVLDFDPKDLPIVDYSVVTGKVISLPEDIISDLSSDQKYLHKACIAIQNEIVQDRQFLESAQPGCLNNARWLTKANRILRYYMSEANPSSTLKRLVSFILNFYAPSWFHIKANGSGQDGAKNFFFMIQLFQGLEERDQEIIRPVLENNCYFAHPENILLSAVGDENKQTRKVAIEKILQSQSVENKIQVFDKQSIEVNFSASTYMDMINWNIIQTTIPPLLEGLIKSENDYQSTIKLPMYPCHSQTVERNVKEISSASTAVFGHEARHGMVLQSKKSRMEIPKIESKSDFQ